ncbi:MAG TPA: hypothetical protein VHE82_06150 [Gemmatimonadaceae bacterium]|nr:hypothetical protein [Gemmatimonadaceae bacterium]
MTVGIAVGLVACKADLGVPNTNNPDFDRALARPGDVESFILNSYGQMHQAAFGVNGSIMPPLLTMSFENASGLANWGMGPRSAMPRAGIANTRGNPYEVENLVQYARLPRAARVAANGVAALRKPGFTIGSAASDQRALAFAYLVMGAANGNLALVYDSVSVVTPEDDIAQGAPANLVGYAEGMAVALKQLDSAIAISARLPGYTLTTGAINTSATTGYTSVQVIQIARGWKARFRAGVARTPAERAVVDWDAVIADAGAALPTDLSITMSAAAGTTWTIATAQHELYDTWSQQPPMIIGMADSVRAGGATCAGGDCYDAWLATPLNSRYRILIRTADQRFPPGETRDAQRTSSGSTPTANFPNPPRANLYFRNRRPTDPTGEAWGVSFYDFYRFQSLWSTFNGPMPVMTRAEMDLLMAEGYIRKGDFVNAMAKINITRVANGKLPALAGITSATDPISTSGSCVPRVPQPPDFTTAACGNIMEAMKWEKRMETIMTHLGAWFIDSRGWGDLPEGTPLHFPVPFQEMDARAKPAYNLGGVGGVGSAARGTYGY